MVQIVKLRQAILRREHACVTPLSWNRICRGSGHQSRCCPQDLTGVFLSIFLLNSQKGTGSKKSTQKGTWTAGVPVHHRIVWCLGSCCLLSTKPSRAAVNVFFLHFTGNARHEVFFLFLKTYAWGVFFVLPAQDDGFPLVYPKSYNKRRPQSKTRPLAFVDLDGRACFFKALVKQRLKPATALKYRPPHIDILLLGRLSRTGS